MHCMFSGCISLKYLIISNFNIESIILNKYENGLDNIFNILQNLEYIDIYNITSQRSLLAEHVNQLNEKDKLTVCNNSVVITNSKAIYDCSNISNNIIDDF